MPLLPLYRDKKHKFKDGQWTWNEAGAKLKFRPFSEDNEEDNLALAAASKGRPGLQFKRNIDEVDEKIFREVFMRPNSFYDGHVITIQDIKSTALFLAKSQVPRDLIEFVHTETTFDKFLHATIIYIDFFLSVLEYLLIRRDDISEGKSRDTHSINVERFVSKRLSDRRCLVGKEYSKVVVASVPSASECKVSRSLCFASHFRFC